MRPLNFNVAHYANGSLFNGDLAAAAVLSPGCTVRLDAVWEYLSDANGVNYNFTDLDWRIQAVKNHGLQVQLMIPYWVPVNLRNGAPQKTQIDTIAGLYGFAAFVQALVAHLTATFPGTTIRGAGLGNEPNILEFAPDGAKPSFQASITNLVFGYFPSSWKIYSPGMAPSSTGGGAMSPLDYLNVYWPALNVQLYGCEVHPYGHAEDVGQSWSFLGALPTIHSLVGVPLAATEYNSNFDDTDAQKAEEVPEGLDYLKSLGTVPGCMCGYVEDTYIYAVSDPATDNYPVGHPWRLGMYNADGSKRALYNAVADWIAANP